MDKNTEREIAKGLRQGSRQAWLQLYEACAEEVWRNVSRLVGYDSPAAADIVQETFLAAARSARHFEPGRGSLRGWLWTIARRQVGSLLSQTEAEHAVEAGSELVGRPRRRGSRLN